ncbi:hypothetical protein P692DRAFT_201418739 [Suillus brevipes Sb2]|nr:hypothetical protein P692DRAFT_201418739 [Suillus brevipes Sb2]
MSPISPSTTVSRILVPESCLPRGVSSQSLKRVRLYRSSRFLMHVYALSSHIAGLSCDTALCACLDAIMQDSIPKVSSGLRHGNIGKFIPLGICLVLFRKTREFKTKSSMSTRRDRRRCEQGAKSQICTIGAFHGTTTYRSPKIPRFQVVDVHAAGWLCLRPRLSVNILCNRVMAVQRSDDQACIT